MIRHQIVFGGRHPTMERSAGGQKLSMLKKDGGVYVYFEGKGEPELPRIFWAVMTGGTNESVGS